MDYTVYATIIFVSAAIFTAIILSLATPPKYTKNVLFWIASLTAIAALGMYGFGYSYQYLHGQTPNTIATSIIFTVMDTCKMFGGSSNWEQIQSAYAGHAGWEILFWIIHLLALTASAGAVISSLGATLLKKIRLRLLRRNDISLIFGLNEDTLEFGQTLSKKTKTAILYVDTEAHYKQTSAVDRMDALFRSDADAIGGSIRFLRSIGLRPGKRKLHIYALSKSMADNQEYARNILVSLENRKIRSEQLALTIFGTDSRTDHVLQAGADRYGYGSIISINEQEMIARLLIRNYPPCETISFDHNGKAVSDFHAIVVGCGQIGQAVLRQLVMNSQFHGCQSRIAVFAPDYNAQIGFLAHDCREMLDHYQISLFPFDGRSRQFYDYLAEHIDSVNYAVVCTENEDIDQETSDQLQAFFVKKHRPISVLTCSSRGIFQRTCENRIIANRIYTPEILYSDEIDRMAMVLNHSYIGQGDMYENWKSCAYFDRMSSRASADFCSTFMHCAGVTREQVLDAWDPRGELLENLSITEHLRWNAFHYCMGFRKMTEEEFQARAAAYRQAKAADPNTRYRVTKDMDNRIHACLIPWDDLDAYSQKENAVTGGDRDYKEYDRQNVRNLSNILRAMDREI